MEGLISQGGDEQVAGGTGEEGGTAGGHRAPCWLLQPKAAQCLPSNGRSLGHKLPSKRGPGSLQQCGEVPHTDTPELVPRTTWGLTLMQGTWLKAGPAGQPMGRGVTSSHF